MEGLGLGWVLMPLVPCLERHPFARMAALPTSKAAKGPAEDTNCSVVDPLWAKAVASEQLQKNAICIRARHWKVDIEELVEGVMKERSVVGLGLCCLLVWNAVRRSEHNVPDHKLWCATVPGIVGKYLRVAIRVEFQSPFSRAVNECAAL